MRYARLALVCIAMFLNAYTCAAITPQTELTFSPSTHLTLGSNNIFIAPNQVAKDDLSSAPGVVANLPLGIAIPDGAAVFAYHLASNGDSLFVSDVTLQLGGVLASPRTVIRYDGSTYTKAFDGAANGVPDGVRIDALAMINDSDFLLSFDCAVSLPGGVFADRADLVRYAAATNSYTVFLSGASVGIPANLNLRDVHFFDHNGHLLVTFDDSGILSGVNFKASDVLEYDRVANTWSLAYSASVRDARWAAFGGEAALTALSARTLRNVLDVDGNGAFTPQNDGLMLTRYLYGYKKPNLASAVSLSPLPARSTDAQIDSYLALIAPFLDIDGDGNYSGTTDGLLIVRYLLGLRGSALVSGATGLSPSRSASQIEWYLGELVR